MHKGGVVANHRCYTLKTERLNIFRFLVQNRKPHIGEGWNSAVSEVQQRQTVPVWMDKPAVRSDVCRSDGVCNVIIEQILHWKRLREITHKPHAPWPNNSNVATVNVFNNLYAEKNTAVICWEVSVILSVLLTLRHISAQKNRICPWEKKQKTHQVFVSFQFRVVVVTVLKKNHCDSQPARLTLACE